MTQVVASVTTPRRPAVGPLLLVVGCAVAYGTFLVLPFVVNGLHLLPAEQVFDAEHDPGLLWPHASGGLMSTVFFFGGMLTFGGGPFLVLVAVAWAGAEGWRRRGGLTVADRCLLGAAMLSGGGAFWVVLNLFDSRLVLWWFD